MAASSCNQHCAITAERHWRFKWDRRGRYFYFFAGLEFLLYTGCQFYWYGARLAELQRNGGFGLRGEIDTIRTALAEGETYDMENVKKESWGEQRRVGEKKAYKTPSFRFEPVFEVAALACGKVFSTQGSCRVSRKAS